MTESSVAVTVRPRKCRGARLSLTRRPPSAMLPAAVVLDIQVGADACWQRTITATSAGELLEALAADVGRLGERLWPAT
jgi:hypothetical protein